MARELSSPEGTTEVQRTQHHDDDNPQAQLIASLRSQIGDLLNQVNQLNGKLVQSYDRVSDLEDTLHVTSSNLRSTTLQISQLEIERAQHLSALNTGLLVEKSTITAELTRLMERVTEETAQRGQAESAKDEIEKDLDDLSANLFAQANTMVAEARYARSLSERKAEEAEEALKGTEEAISLMQVRMQLLRDEKERCERETEAMHELMGKGKWVLRDRSTDVMSPPPRLSASTVPHHEFLLFLSHVRALRTSGDQIPALASLLQLPFIARLQAEDSDPTLRLDLAPSLNWLTRRSVLSAIHSGQLIVEPVASHRLHLDPSLATSILSPSSIHDLTCALCGKQLFPVSVDSSRPRPHLGHQSSASWVSTSRFIKSQLSTPSSPRTTPSTDSLTPVIAPPQTYVFRLALPPPTTPTNGPPKSTPMYPLCHDGFCLIRLRSTCELWQFVRISLIEHVWNEPRPPPPKIPRSHSDSLENGHATAATTPTGSFPPAVPPRRNVAARVGNLWGMGIGALSREKSASRGATPPPEPEMEKRRLPPPYPRTSSPTISRRESIESNSLPKPPLPPRRRPTNEVHASPSPAKSARDRTPEPDTPTKVGGVLQNLFGSESDVPSDKTTILEEGASLVGSDAATVVAKPENSGLLTPRSEQSDGFETPPEQMHGIEPPAESSPQAGPAPDPAHLFVANTQLPVPRPISQAADVDSGRQDAERNLPSMAAANEEEALSSPEKSNVPESPQVRVPPSPPLVTTNASPRPPPPLPRRAAARERPMSMLKSPCRKWLGCSIEISVTSACRGGRRSQTRACPSRTRPNRTRRPKNL
ncbi:hypothetical protein BS47DRAFT_475012 [Hydnum rufescens UP504]|uniref:GDP/GTP exchange factor Sec2 N-terminal domain-containing protein n=1 Tax=Hydnum rufescens UP504 TaxID=1448309 RepID=A0A9P6B5C6_9AGAM|nr:hypothetical protein BS47DRAFT_475012 [Hydnum rufescens UP504]